MSYQGTVKDELIPRDSTGAATFEEGAATFEESDPSSYRLARRENGEVILQGAYKWWNDTGTGFRWRDIPTVDLAAESSDKE